MVVVVYTIIGGSRQNEMDLDVKGMAAQERVLDEAVTGAGGDGESKGLQPGGAALGV
jgi:hypothetical protein